ncbi:citrulline utilization hydrolase CtlX [Flavobacteriaceae bacterium 14752]|uniref:citrulline utilization hydrolase CtlX n=1 Tax=Mesohalobacter salilacus TaxID=2491711 RepID=UPI000F6354B8|nr:amidinotransferase [Flavobacteriaceae bacterium 14752]
MKQSTDKILMIRPVAFEMNKETAVNNYFQKTLNLKTDEVNTRVQKEFDDFVKVLQSAGIHVFVYEDIADLKTPDSIFPNNWISFHENGNIVLYPMFAENRRRERRQDILEGLEKKGFQFHQVYDYTAAEDENVFLEGTGSLILDRENRKAYCALSPRANEELLFEFCEDFEYLPIPFKAYQTVDNKRLLIYHTNVMMCVGTDIAVVCFDSIDDKAEKKLLSKSLKEDGKTIIEISEKQLEAYAGNMLEVQNEKGDKFLVMSTQAYESLNETQIQNIEQHLKILHSPINTIETLGGGSARCMMAEIFNDKA